MNVLVLFVATNTYLALFHILGIEGLSVLSFNALFYTVTPLDFIMRKYKDTDSNDEFLAWFPLLFQPSCQTTSELNYFLVAVAGVISDDQKLDMLTEGRVEEAIFQPRINISFVIEDSREALK